MKVLIVNDTTNWYHFGCTGTSVALKKEIENLGYSVSSFTIAECAGLKYSPKSILSFFEKDAMDAFIVANDRLCNLIRESDAVVKSPLPVPVKRRD